MTLHQIFNIKINSRRSQHNLSQQNSIILIKYQQMEGLIRCKPKKSIHDKENQHNNRQQLGRTLRVKAIYVKDNLFNSRNALTPIAHQTNSFEEEQDLIKQMQEINLSPKESTKIPTNSETFLKDYERSIIDESMEVKPLGSFLQKHKIDSELRGRMLDWMTEVTCSYRFEAKSYFDGISYLDSYLKAKKNSVEPTELHALGIVCMLIASKMNEILPLRIGLVYEKIGHRKIPLSKLTAVEADVLETIGYKLNMWTFFDIATISISGFQNDLMLQVLTFVCRFVAIQYEFYSKVSPALLGEACAWFVCEIFEKEKPKWMNKEEDVVEYANQIFSLIIGFHSVHSNFKNADRFTDKAVVQKVYDFILKIENDI